MKKIVYLSMLLLTSQLATAQLDYNTAIGLRAGETSGLTLKKAMGSNAIEGIIGVWGHGLSVTGLYEWVVPAGASGLNWYYGIGGHVAFETGYYGWYKHGRREKYYKEYYNGGFGLGVDGVLGIEFKIPKAPIAISFDLKPYIEINTGGGMYSSLDPGLGIKVAF